MAEGSELATHTVDLLQVFGPCEARRMFGGFGIFHQGLMFALVADGHLYLKADDENRARFEAEDSEIFSYLRQGKECRLSYYRAPESFFEDTEACLDWARISFDAALRKASRSSRVKS
jgi:DNA transformation protein